MNLFIDALSYVHGNEALSQKTLTIRVVLLERFGDFRASCNEHTLLFFDVLTELLERSKSSRAAYDTTVKAYCHHFGHPLLTLLIQDVECILQVIEERIRISEARSNGVELEVITIVTVRCETISIAK
jgi:hypothetical protein